MFAKRTVLVLLVLLSTTAFAQTADPMATRPVNVLIDSRPDIAEIRVDGRFIGTGPLQYRLTPGVHKIELSRPRYATWTRELTVVPGVPTRVVALLGEQNTEVRCGE
jgi:hypothetical protein